MYRTKKANQYYYYYLYQAISFGKHYKKQGIAIKAFWRPFWNNERAIFL